MYKLFSRFLIISMFLVFFSGIIRAAFVPVDINVYENRPAYQLGELNLQSFINGSFQSSMDNALADQFPLSSYLKKIYNLIDSRYTLTFSLPLSERFPDNYLACKSSFLFNGYFCHGLHSAEDFSKVIAENALEFSAAAKRNPDTDFFVYVVENEEHINFETMEKSGVSDLILQSFDCPADHKKVFSINNFSDYSRLFYRGDHHWNHEGAYLAYCEVLGLLLPGENPIVPESTVKVSDVFTGLTATQSGLDSFSEDFYANIYSLPQYSYQIKREHIESLNLRSEFLMGTAESEISYGSFYGGDHPETIISSPNEHAKNILIIGDSYDNAIIELLANHFKNIFSVDLRYYELLSGESFDIDSYIADNAIDSVLVIGSVNEVFGSHKFTLGS